MRTTAATTVRRAGTTTVIELEAGARVSVIESAPDYGQHLVAIPGLAGEWWIDDDDVTDAPDVDRVDTIENLMFRLELIKAGYGKHWALNLDPARFDDYREGLK